MSTIRNTYDQLLASGGGVAITPSVGGARTTYVNGWLVYRVDSQGKEIQTDSKAPWYQYGKKSFSQCVHRGTFHERQAAALEAAKR